MSHTVHAKKALQARVRRLKGQMEAVDRALEDGRDCAEVLQLLASIRGALNGLVGELMEGHLREHVLAAEDEAARATAVEEISAVLRTYMK